MYRTLMLAIICGVLAFSFGGPSASAKEELRVVPNLSRQTVFATLSLIARLPDGEVVFDYGEPVEAYPRRDVRATRP